MIERTHVFEDAWAKWDRIATPEAFARLVQVMEHDSMTFDRGDGEGRLRPSSLAGPCSRLKMLSYHGYRGEPASRQMENMGMQGTWGHYRHQLMGLSTGLLTDIEVKVNDDDLMISGAIDGITVDPAGVEIKTLHGNYYNRLFGSGSHSDGNPVEKHLIQTHAYMRALNIRKFIVLYENRSDGDLTEFTVHFDETVESQLLNIVNPLLVHIEAGTLPDLLPLCKQMTGKIYNECLWKEPCFREL